MVLFAPRTLGISAAILAAILAAGTVVAAADGAPPAAATLRFELYFPSPQVEEADRRAAFADAAALVATPASGAMTAPRLLALMRRFDAVLVRLYRHRAYLKFRSSENVDDGALSAAVDAADAQWSIVNSAMDRKLALIDRTRLRRSVHDDPRLRPYAFVVHKASEEAGHTVPAAQDAAGANAAAAELTRLRDDYRRIVASAQYPKVDTTGGAVDPRSEAATTNAERAVRVAAAEARTRTRAGIEQPLADVLLAIAHAQDERARALGFSDAPSARYSGLGLTSGQVHAVLEAIARHANLRMDYRELLAADTARRLGIADVRSYDLNLPPAGFTPPVFTFEDARAIVPQALRPLGREYVTQFTALLDPRDGRLDLTGGAKRDDDGYSQGFPGSVSALYVSPYRGTVDNLRTLIHEGGHAVHRELVRRNHVLPVNASGPNYESEGIAIFNEFLLWDYLARTATTKEWKAYYLRRFLDDVTFQVFGSSEETSLEEAIHRGVIAGTVRNAADLDALSLAAVGRYDAWTAREPSQRQFWLTRSLFFRDPLYSVNYLYAGLLAAEFYRLQERDRAHFSARYTALLANGFTDDPDVLLRRFLGIELHGTRIVDDAAALVAEKTAELRDAQAP